MSIFRHETLILVLSSQQNKTPTQSFWSYRITVTEPKRQRRISKCLGAPGKHKKSPNLLKLSEPIGVHGEIRDSWKAKLFYQLCCFVSCLMALEDSGAVKELWNMFWIDNLQSQLKLLKLRRAAFRAYKNQRAVTQAHIPQGCNVITYQAPETEKHNSAIED